MASGVGLVLGLLVAAACCWAGCSGVATPLSAPRTVHRMQQYDLRGEPLGSRSSKVDLRAAAAGSPGTTGSLSRHCVVIPLADLTAEWMEDLVNERAAGAVLALVPPAGADTHKEELQLVKLQVQAPVYFVEETPELRALYESLASQAVAAGPKRGSVLGSAVSSSFLISIDAPPPTKIADLSVRNLQAKLTGSGPARERKEIVVVAHHDSFGVAPSLSGGADSNGSGIIAILELSRIFSQLYSSPRTRPRHDLTFLLTGGGKLNFAGTHAWLERANPSKIDFALCLDSIGSGSELNLHVSKAPAEGTPLHAMLAELQSVSKSSSTSVNVVRKKIVLPVKERSWEHEPMRIKKVSAATLSHHSAAGPLGELFARSSILDTSPTVSVDALARNTHTIGEALARLVYNLSSTDIAVPVEVLSGSLDVDKEFVQAWLRYLSDRPRAVQTAGTTHEVLSTIQDLLRNKYALEVSMSEHKVDPKFIEFYDGTTADMTISTVKPALFDILMLLGVAAYLVALYCLMEFVSPFLVAKAKTL